MSYKGFTNKATFEFAEQLDNDAGCEKLIAQARQLIDADSVRFSQIIREHFDSVLFIDVNDDFVRDLLKDVLSDVNWVELAHGMIEHYSEVVDTVADFED